MMIPKKFSNFWTTNPQLPDYSPPEKISFSTHQSIKQCPRKYYYERLGYPRSPNLSVLSGNVLHEAMRTIIKKMNEASCEDPYTSEFVNIMTELGGYKSILIALQKKELTKQKDNPRFNRQLPFIIRKNLRNQAGLQSKLQSMCGQIQLEKQSHQVSNDSGYVKNFTVKQGQLKEGSYPEEWLNSDRINWKGQIDLLKVSKLGVEITDFKSGETQPSHEDQLRLYQILWMDDKQKNKDNLEVKKLIVMYPNQIEKISPLTNEEADVIRANYKEFSEKYTQISDYNEFPPKVFEEVCKDCFCRQLCEDYWDSLRNSIRVSDEKKINIDCEIIITSDKSSTKTSKVIASSIENFPDEIGVCLQNLNDDFSHLLTKGNTIRILNATLIEGEETRQPSYLQINSWTEVYLKEPD